MDIFSNIFALAVPGKKKEIETVDALSRTADPAAGSKNNINRKIVSYNPARNRTLQEQANEIEFMKKQREQGSLSRQEYSIKRREVLGL